MASLKQHQTDGTYYTVVNLGGYVTRQIHPEGVVFLKRNGVPLFGEIPSWLMSELRERNWLFTKEEMHCRGEIDWSPHWHLIGLPKPKPFPKENPFVTRQRERERAAAEAEKRAEQEAERQKEESKREARREQQRKYRAGKRAETEEAEAKRAAKREQQRQYRARKKAETEAAWLTAARQVGTPNPAEMQVDELVTTTPATLASTAQMPLQREENEHTHVTPFAAVTRGAERRSSPSKGLRGASDSHLPPSSAAEQEATSTRSPAHLWIWVAIAVIFLLGIAATMLLS